MKPNQTTSCALISVLLICKLSFGLSLKYKPEGVTVIKEINHSGEEKIVFDNNPPAVSNSSIGLRTADTPGSLPGAAGVSPMGSATYTIPIWVSPGTNGMQPKLDIIYNSAAGNGIMGIGWAISGLSAITRTSLDHLHFSTVLPVSFNGTDRYQLDGNLMFTTAGNYHYGGATYYTETTTFDKIVSFGTSGNSPDHFIVYRKDGAILEYGNTPDSKVEAQGLTTPLLWQLNKITDASGNYMKYYYNENNGESTISKIEYTFNDAQGLNTPFANVEFLYDNKAISFVGSAYIGGTNLLQTKKLIQIKINCGTNASYLERKYEFTYDNANDRELHLIAIRYSDKNGKYINDTQINWGVPNTTNNTQIAASGFLAFHGYQLCAGDFNGDGIDDIVSLPIQGDYEPGDQFALYLGNTAGTLAVACTTSQAYDNLQKQWARVGDINGDGKAEFIVIYEDANGHRVVAYSYLNGIMYVSANYLIPENCDFALETGDFDGDGKTDVYVVKVENDNANPDWYIARFDGGVFTTWLSGEIELFRHYYIIDLTGDGKAELMTVKDGNTTIYEYSSSLNTLHEIYNTGYPTIWHGIFPGDFNGDGKTDLLIWSQSAQALGVCYSNGVDFNSKILIPALGTFPNKPDNNTVDGFVSVADFNGDGSSDVLIDKRVGATTTLTCNFFKPSLFIWNESISYTGQSTAESYTAGDFNGDGKMDCLFRWWELLNGLFQQSSHLYVAKFHANEKVNLVHSITNGYDKTDNFVYFPLSILGTTSTSYIKGTGAIFPVYDYQGAMNVVSSIWESDPSQNMLNYKTYSYKGAKIHRQSRGFLCFEEINVRLIKTNMVESTKYSYHPGYFYPFVTETANLYNNTILNKIEFVNNRKFYGVQFFFPYIEKKTITDFVKVSKIETLYDYSIDGNLLHETTTASNPMFNNIEYVSHSDNSYSNFANPFNAPPLGASPTPNRLTESTVTTTYTGQQSYSVYKKNEYDLFNGNLITEKIIPDGNANQYILKEYTYNNFCGLINESKQTGTDVNGLAMTPRTTNFIYDQTHRYIIESINPESQHSYADYDYATGNVVLSIPVDGLGTRYIYDGFGRNTEVTTPRQAANSLDNTLSNVNYATGTGNEPVNCSYSTVNQAPGSPVVINYYDFFNRLIRTETEKINSTGMLKSVLKDKTYESGINRLQFESQPYFVGDVPKLTKYNYSATDGRISSIVEDIYGINRITSFTYQNNEVKTTKPGNTQPQEQTTVKNISGQVVAANDGNGWVYYEYFSHGKPKHIYTDIFHVWMEYDAWANQTILDDGDAGKYTYEYNSLGELTKQKNPNGHEFIMEYNLLGQVTLKTENPTTSPITTSYTYQLPYLAAANKVKSILKSDGSSIEYVYDDVNSGISSAHVGDLLSFSQSDGNVTLTSSYLYDPFGREEFKTYPSLLQTKNTFNSIGNLIQIDDVSNAQTPVTIWSNPKENALGQPLSYNFGDPSNLLDAKFDYKDNFPLSREIKNNGSVFWDQGYVFNNQTGNLTSRSQLYNNLSESFQYDQFAFQLALASGSGGLVNVTHLAEGNIQKDDIGTYTYPSSGNVHAVTEINSTSLLPNEPISLNTQSIKYNAFNKPYEIEEDNLRLNIYYGPDDERFKTELTDISNNTSLKVKYFAPNYEYIPVCPTYPNERHLNYIMSPYGIVAVIEMDNSNNTKVINYIATDYLGSINLVFDANSNIIQETSFDAWGRRRDPATWHIYNHNNPAPQGLFFERGYTGHEHLEEFDLINMNGRMYDPAIGRMLSPDNFNNSPLSTLGLNRYAYAMNNPLKFTDPSGNEAVVAVIIVGAVVGLYLGGTAANGGEYNPTKWNFKSGNTWAGMGIGAVIGAAAGYGAGALGGYLAGTAAFTAFGSSGTVAAYVIAGGIAGAATGYLTGLGTGLILSKGDWNYAHHVGKLYAGVGANIGSVAGLVFGGVEQIKNMRSAMPNMNMPVVEPPADYTLVASSDNSFTSNTSIMRPDADGYITLAEAKYWRKNGHGEPLYASLNKIDFSQLCPSDFAAVNIPTLINLEGRSLDGEVYGRIYLTHDGNLNVSSDMDVYNFDIVSWAPELWARNIGTILGRIYNGSGQTYDIFFYGMGKISPTCIDLLYNK